MRRITCALMSAAMLVAGCGDGGPTPGTPASLAQATNASDYVGEYTRTDGTPIYVFERDGGLLVVVTGNAFGLVPAGPDRFDLDGVPETVSFERDGDGRVVTVADSQGRYPRASSDVPDAILAQYGDVKAETYSYAAPEGAEPGLAVGDAAAANLDTAALEAVVEDLRTDPDYANVHALLVSKDGQLVLEEYLAGFDANQPHDLRSATKSVIAGIVGAAVRRGDADLNDRPLRILAAAADVPITAHKAQLTLGDMLDLRHGLACDDWDQASPGNEARIYGEPDWTAFILDVPDADDPDRVSYCSAMPLMVGRYLEVQTGRPLPDYAQEVLFEPLGIAREGWTWDFDLRAQETPHGAQVHLRPRDMLRFGRLYANGGTAADGARVLPEGWTETAFTETQSLGDWRRYGDYWWTYDIEREGADPLTVHMASGVGGQRIALVLDKDLVVVMTGGSFVEGRGGPRQVIERVSRAADG